MEKEIVTLSELILADTEYNELALEKGKSERRLFNLKENIWEHYSLFNETRIITNGHKAVRVSPYGAVDAFSPELVEVFDCEKEEEIIDEDFTFDE